MKQIKHFTLLCFLLCLSKQFLWGQSQPLDQFISKMYIHGVPYEEAKSYGATAIPTLASFLEDPNFEPYLSNIIITMGHIGSPNATPHLLKFIELQSGEISEQRFIATLTVFQALGHISQSGDPIAMQALMDYKEETNWQTKPINYRFAQYQNAVMGEVIARMAIQGLGISGRPEAMAALRALENNPTTRADWADNVSEAKALNQKIQIQGVSKVFRKKK